MTAKELLKLALTEEPPEKLLEYCGEYYAPYYNLLYLAAKDANGIAVELGVEKGRGSLAMALAGGSVYGIDHTMRLEVLEIVRRFRNFTFLQRSSLPVCDMIEKAGPIGVLHIDTEHSYAMAREEFNAYREYLADGAWVCFDDLHAQNDGVKAFFDTLGEFDRVESDLLHSCGYGVLHYVHS